MILLTETSCARTVYTNLHPQLPEGTTLQNQPRDSPRYWRHFFIYGWVPAELIIDAESYCQGTEHIDRIETRSSFVQGLVSAVAGYYINIYSPYTGRVVCSHHTDTH
jgi:hypothetical protein